MAKRKIPSAVNEEVRWYLDNCKGSVIYLGSSDGLQYWQFIYSEEVEAGFPVVVQFDGVHALQLPDIEALHVACKFA